MKKINIIDTIKAVSINDLHGYENNPRRISEQAIDAVAESIKEFGFKIPIVIDSNNIIVAGHTRLEAAKKLGLKKVPCIIADDLNPDQINAFRLVDNKTSELSGWDFEKLEEEIGALEDFNFELFGFDNNEEYAEPDNFFTEAEEEQSIEKDTKSVKTHIITCPDCGAEIEVDEHFKTVEH